MNVLKSSVTVARKDLKVLLKGKGQLAVCFLLPLLLASILGAFYAALAGPASPGVESRLVIKTYLVNEDPGPHGTQVESVLRGISSLSLLRARDAVQADELVAEGKAPAAIIIPGNFGSQIDANQPARVQLIKDPAQQVEARAVAGMLNEVLAELSIRAEIEAGIRAALEQTGVLAGADDRAVRAAQAQTMGVIWAGVQEMRQNPAVTVQREDLTGEPKHLPTGALTSALYTPLFCTMFAFFLVGAMAESLLGEREAGSFRRLLAAPIPRGTVVGGKMLAFLGVVFGQMLLLFGVGHALFRMPLGDSPLGLLTLTLALALAATGLGMLVGSVARTSKQAGHIGLVLGFVLYLASGYTGGTLSPTGFSPGLEGWWLVLSQVTPHAHAIDGYLKLLLEGADLVDILPNVLALLGFGLVFFLIGLWRFRYE